MLRFFRNFSLNMLIVVMLIKKKGVVKNVLTPLKNLQQMQQGVLQKEQFK